MHKFLSLEIPDFDFEKIIDHPSYPGLKVRFYAVPEDTKETFPSDADMANLIIERVNDGNLAAWFRCGIAVFSELDNVEPEEVVIAHCTCESFDDFMESEVFESVVSELTQDLFELNKNNPAFLTMFTPANKILS